LEGIVGGWQGLIRGWTREITPEIVDLHRNLGGQEMLCHFGGETIRKTP
jgi:hypothetical protein